MHEFFALNEVTEVACRFAPNSWCNSMSFLGRGDRRGSLPRPLSRCSISKPSLTSPAHLRQIKVWKSLSWSNRSIMRVLCQACLWGQWTVLPVISGEGLCHISLLQFAPRKAKKPKLSRIPPLPQHLDVSNRSFRTRPCRCAQGH